MKRFAVLLSGAGTNLQAIIDAWNAGHISGQLALVVSNRPQARGLQRAADAGISHVCLDHKGYPDRVLYDRALIEVLEKHDVEWVILAGFMRIFSASFTEHFAGRILNIHPSLLPAFPGIHALEQALEAGVKVTGVTVHFVDSGVDTGPIIAQEAVPVNSDDTAETLARKVQRIEHALYPRVIDLVLQGKVCVSGRHVTIPGESSE